MIGSLTGFVKFDIILLSLLFNLSSSALWGPQPRAAEQKTFGVYNFLEVYRAYYASGQRAMDWHLCQAK